MMSSLRHFHENYIRSLALRHSLCDALYPIEGRFFIRRCIKNRKKKHISSGKHIIVRRTPVRLVGNLPGSSVVFSPPLVAGLLSRECANAVNDDFLRSSRASELKLKQNRVNICKNVAIICSLHLIATFSWKLHSQPDTATFSLRYPVPYWRMSLHSEMHSKSKEEA